MLLQTLTMLQNKGGAHISTVSWCGETCTVLLILCSGSMVATPGECNASQLFTLLQWFTINYYCKTIVCNILLWWMGIIFFCYMLLWCIAMCVHVNHIRYALAMYFRNAKIVQWYNTGPRSVRSRVRIPVWHPHVLMVLHTMVAVHIR